MGIEMLTEIKHMTQLGKNASQGAFWIRNTISKATAPFVSLKPTSYKQAQR